MGYLSLFDKVERLVVGKDAETEYWIDYKPVLSTGDTQECERFLAGASQEVTQVGNEPVMKSSANIMAYQNEAVVRMIVDWNLTDENGVMLPRDTVEQKRESVKRLPIAVFNKLLATYTENTKLEERVDAPFRGADAGGNKARGRR